MQTINDGFAKPSSPKHPFVTTSSLNVHVQTHFDKNSSKVIHVTNYNQNSLLHSDAFFEDSSDSYIMDTDTEDCSMPGKPNPETESYLSFITALKAADEIPTAVKTESNEPYHLPNRKLQHTSDSDISPQKELKALMKDINATPNDSSGQPNSSYSIDKLSSAVPTLEIIEEPETTYRARYESEGCKGPIHGASETGFPTVRVRDYVGEVVLTVFVVTRDNEPHLHTATGPGSSKVPCKEVLIDNQIPAVQMLMQPEDENDEMIAVFDQLSIKRIRNWEADKELRKRGIEPSSWKSKKKEAKLYFQAEISKTNKHPAYLLKAYSKSFLCTAPSGNPEIWWTSQNECSAQGGIEMGLIGKKFAAGFKVRFFSKEDDGMTWESYAEIDRAKSNLNACVIKVPPYKELDLLDHVVVHLEIRAGPDKEPRYSDPFSFTYIPVGSPIASACENCENIRGILQTLVTSLNVKPSGDGNDKILSSPLTNLTKSLQLKPIANVIPNVTISSSDIRNLINQSKPSEQLLLKDTIVSSLGQILYNVGTDAGVLSSNQEVVTSSQAIFSINANAARNAILPPTYTALPTAPILLTDTIHSFRQNGNDTGRFISVLSKPIVSLASNTPGFAVRNIITPSVGISPGSLSSERNQVAMVGTNTSRLNLPVVTTTVCQSNLAVASLLAPISSTSPAASMESDKVKEKSASPNTVDMASLGFHSTLLRNLQSSGLYNIESAVKSTTNYQQNSSQTQLNEAQLNISQELQALKDHVESLKKQIQFGALRTNPCNYVTMPYQPQTQFQQQTMPSMPQTTPFQHTNSFQNVATSDISFVQQSPDHVPASLAPISQSNRRYSSLSELPTVFSQSPLISSQTLQLPIDPYRAYTPQDHSGVHRINSQEFSGSGLGPSHLHQRNLQIFPSQGNVGSIYQQQHPNQQILIHTPPPTPTVQNTPPNHSGQSNPLQTSHSVAGIYQQSTGIPASSMCPTSYSTIKEIQTHLQVNTQMSSASAQPQSDAMYQPSQLAQPLYEQPQQLVALACSQPTTFEHRTQSTSSEYEHQAAISSSTLSYTADASISITNPSMQQESQHPTSSYQLPSMSVCQQSQFPTTSVFNDPQGQTPFFQQQSQQSSSSLQQIQQPQMTSPACQQEITASYQSTEATDPFQQAHLATSTIPGMNNVSQFYQTQELSPSSQMFTNLQCVTSFANATYNGEQRPSINDAIESNKVGFPDAAAVIKHLSRPASPMEINVPENDDSHFLKTFRQLNNTEEKFHTSLQYQQQQLQQQQKLLQQQQLQQQEQQQNEQAAHNLSGLETTLSEHEVSVDYSDAYRKLKENDSSNTWNQPTSTVYHQSNNNTAKTVKSMLFERKGFS